MTVDEPPQPIWACSIEAREPRPRRTSGNRQTLPSPGAAALQDEAAVLSAHALEKTVGLAAAAAIWLESALHGMRLRSNGLCQTAELAMVPGPDPGCQRMVGRSRRAPVEPLPDSSI